MATEIRNPIRAVYLGKAENGYYISYHQPTTGKQVFLTEPSLEILAETLSVLNVVQEEGTLQNEKLSKRLSRREYSWLKNYIETPKEKEIIVSLKQGEKNQEGDDKKCHYGLYFTPKRKSGRKYLIFDGLPTIVEHLYNQRTASYRIRRRNLPWKQYAFILTALEERRNR